MVSLRSAGLMLTALLAGGALAQTPEPKTPELQPSAAQQCLTHAAGKDAQPEYPAAEFNHNVGGRVQVELSFNRPDRAPEVTILLQHASQRLVDAVQEHLRGLRVPCLDDKSAPARLKQDFIFAVDRRQVHWTGPVDTDQGRRAALLSCFVHANGSIRPDYPMRQLRQAIQGRVLARVRFASATDPPAVEVYARDYASGLADEVKDWLKDTRLPCHSGAPLTGVWVFEFMIEGERYGFKELSFSQFLSRTKGIQRQTLALDTTTMGCPFDVRLHYRQPAMRNAAGDVGEANPARRPLLEWMAAAELDLSRTAMDSIFGDLAKITVPCLKIDLKPQEKS